MSKRARWKAFAALAAVLVVAVVALCLFIGKARERKEYVSQMDPRSGYRCHFTLSSDWRKGSWSPSALYGRTQELDYIKSFVPTPPNPIMSWIATHLFHQAGISVLPPSILLLSLKANEMKYYFRVQAGYPEPLRGGQGQLTILIHRHLRIDGFPATIVTEAGQYCNGVTLLVYVPDHSMSYEVNGLAATQDAASLDREMQAIIASFHIEKVVPTVGVR